MSATLVSFARGQLHATAAAGAIRMYPGMRRVAPHLSVRSSHPRVLPRIIPHEWSFSAFEQIQILAPLAEVMWSGWMRSLMW